MKIKERKYRAEIHFYIDGTYHIYANCARASVRRVKLYELFQFQITTKHKQKLINFKWFCLNFNRMHSLVRRIPLFLCVCVFVWRCSHSQCSCYRACALMYVSYLTVTDTREKKGSENKNNNWWEKSIHQLLATDAALTPQTYKNSTYFADIVFLLRLSLFVFISFCS